jgi:tetratricopeptide (TPR) repeat protein
MRAGKRGSILLLFPAIFCAALCCHAGQAGPDAGYPAKRQKAVELFAQGNRLDALPLLEELVKANPKDDAMLVDLAASLVEHAATLSDEEAAGKERLRARQLLEQAWQLGNTSPLALNLAQLLRQLPASGAIKFSDNPQVEQRMEAGEAAFSRRDFDEAIREYSRALELEPANYSAALFTGNSYDKEGEFAKAAPWYERAIQMDPNVETAYRYYADMAAKQGEMSKARDLLIRAAVAEPYNRMVWRELHAWATLNHTEIKLVYVSIPPQTKDKDDAHAGDAADEMNEVASAWKTYWAVRASWQQGGEFKKHFPQQNGYRHSLAEESAALAAAAERLQALKQDQATAQLVTRDAAAALLLKLRQTGLVEPYVLFSLGDEGIAKDYAAYRAANRKKLEEYMETFVVPKPRE